MANSTNQGLIIVLALLSCVGTLLAAQPRQCLSCEGINCQRTNRQNATSRCSDALDVCVTVFEGFTISERGCFLDLSVAARAKCEVDGPHLECQKCLGELCNDKGRVDFRCIECSGSQTAKCNEAAEGLEPVQCGAPTSANSYCYVRQVDSKNVQRGCALSVQEQSKCLDDSDCALCLPEDGLDLNSGACNTFELNGPKASGAPTLRMLSVASLLLAFLAFMWLN